MTGKGTADITIMTIDVVTTNEGMMIRDMTVVAMIVATMIAITVATAIAMTTTIDPFNVVEKQGAG